MQFQNFNEKLPLPEGKEEYFKAFHEGVIYGSAKQLLEKNGIDILRPGISKLEGPYCTTEEWPYTTAKRYHRATEKIMSLLIYDFWNYPDIKSIRETLGFDPYLTDSEIHFILDTLMTYKHVDITNRNTDNEVLYKLPRDYLTKLFELQGKMPSIPIFVYIIAAAAGITVLYNKYLK